MALKTKTDMCYDYVKDRVLSGEWQPGDKLPSVKGFAEIGFKYGPYLHAMRMLKLQRLIEGRQGDGVYVRPKEDWRIIDD